MADTINWLGISGKKYTYWLHEIGATYKDEGGNYGFAKELPNGNFTPLYFGEGSNLRDRVTTAHERWAEAVRLGATHWMGHTTPAGDQARLAEERDLIQQWNPPLNVQHRTRTG